MQTTPPGVAVHPVRAATRIRAHLAIARVDHWTKNVFILPGILIPMSVGHFSWDGAMVWRLFVGVLATCCIASSNYVLNEILDAPFDRLHPTKKDRPVARGLVNLPVAYG